MVGTLLFPKCNILFFSFCSCGMSGGSSSISIVDNPGMN